MTYFAPRQGRFAIVLLVSFCLHIVFFVLTCEYGAKKHNQAFAYQVSEQLQNELKLPLAINDRVGSTMILGRYKGDERLGHLGLYDVRGGLMMAVGEKNAEDSTQESEANQDVGVIKVPIINGTTPLGTLVVESKQTSRAAIIGEYWLFLLAVLVVHSVVWLSYGYIARPNKKLLDEISKEVRRKLLAMQGVLMVNSGEPSEVLTTPFLAGNSSNTTPQKTTTANINGELLPMLTGSNKGEPSIFVPDTNPSVELCVSFWFSDYYKLLSVLADDARVAYFYFCDELLQKCLVELLALPSSAGVCVASVERFGHLGATVYLAKTTERAQLVKVATMLSALMAKTYQTAYDKHRQLGWFGLPIKSMIYDKKYKDIAKQLSVKHSESAIVLLDEDNLEVLKGEFSVTPLQGQPSPGKFIVYEKACRAISEPSNIMLSVLQKLEERAFGV